MSELPAGDTRDVVTGRQIRIRRTSKAERAAQIELGKLLEQASAGAGLADPGLGGHLDGVPGAAQRRGI
jgi:hypothetical protein